MMEKRHLLTLTRGKIKFQCGFSLEKFPLSTALLHPKELVYYQSLSFPLRQNSYLLGRVAAKKAIAQLCPHLTSQKVHISQGVFDFPVVNYEEVIAIKAQVSISHCEHLGVALAFPEEHPMGIDIEEVDATKQEAMQSQMTDQDLSLLHAVDKTSPSGVSMLWCMKEALSKVLKTGLMIDFKLLSLQSLQQSGNSHIATFEHFPQYQAVGYTYGGYACSIALPQKTSIDISSFELAIRNTSI